MYSDKPTVNILTSLMVDKGIRRVIVCPGSRNIPLIHNFSECPYIDCYPVTDERSAGFYAIGMSLATAEPVAICVTSGSALEHCPSYSRGVLSMPAYCRNFCRQADRKNR